MKQTEWFLKRYPNQYKAENARTPILTFFCGVGILSVVLVLYNRYCLDARKLPDGEAVDWRLMYYLKKHIPALRNFGIPYREYKPDDF
ncbi:Protein LDOC1 [Dirofilaria immitis]